MNDAIGKLQQAIARARQARFYREQIRLVFLATALGVGLLFASTDAHALGPLNVEVAGQIGRPLQRQRDQNERMWQPTLALCRS
jgi:hypothetical protein